MNRRRYILCMVLLLAFSQAAGAKNHYFKHYGISDGLAHQTVYSAVQDLNGFMWFGTDHWCTRWNLNLLWLSPLLVLIAIRLERSPRWALWLQEGCFAVAAVWVLWCGLSVAIIPIILTLALRVAGRMR